MRPSCEASPCHKTPRRCRLTVRRSARAATCRAVKVSRHVPALLRFSSSLGAMRVPCRADRVDVLSRRVGAELVRHDGTVPCCWNTAARAGAGAPRDAPLTAAARSLRASRRVVQRRAAGRDVKAPSVVPAIFAAFPSNLTSGATVACRGLRHRAVERLRDSGRVLPHCDRAFDAGARARRGGRHAAAPGASRRGRSARTAHSVTERRCAGEQLARFQAGPCAGDRRQAKTFRGEDERKRLRSLGCAPLARSRLRCAVAGLPQQDGVGRSTARGCTQRGLVASLLA